MNHPKQERTAMSNVTVTPLEHRASWAQHKTYLDEEPRPRAPAKPLADPLVTIRFTVPTSERDRWQAIARDRGVELDQLVEEAARSVLGSKP